MSILSRRSIEVKEIGSKSVAFRGATARRIHAAFRDMRRARTGKTALYSTPPFRRGSCSHVTSLRL